MVNSVMSLMENGREDGEEAGTFDSTYVDVSCVVTSDTDGMIFAAGERTRPNVSCGVSVDIMRRFSLETCLVPVCRASSRGTVTYLKT